MLSKLIVSTTISIAAFSGAGLISADTTRVYVRDANGNPIADAKVIGSWDENKVLTDRRGRAKLKDSPRAGFVLIVEKKGFRPYKKEFDFSKKRLSKIRVTLTKKKPQIPSTPIPPRKETKVSSTESTFSLHGSRFWKLVKGNGDVWTDENKFTKVEMEIELRPAKEDPSVLELKVGYTVREGAGGNGTMFSGVHTRRLLQLVGRRIVGLQAMNSKTAPRPTLKFQTEFYRHGKVHGAQSHDTASNSFIKNLHYTIDSFRFDNEDIGMSGTLHYLVHHQAK